MSTIPGVARDAMSCKMLNRTPNATSFSCCLDELARPGGWTDEMAFDFDSTIDSSASCIAALVDPLHIR